MENDLSALIMTECYRNYTCHKSCFFLLFQNDLFDKNKKHDTDITVSSSNHFVLVKRKYVKYCTTIHSFMYPHYTLTNK